MRTGPPVRGADLLTAHAPKTISATRIRRPGNHIHQLIPNIDPISQASTEHLLLPGSHARIVTHGPLLFALVQQPLDLIGQELVRGRPDLLESDDAVPADEKNLQHTNHT